MGGRENMGGLMLMYSAHFSEQIHDFKKTHDFFLNIQKYESSLLVLTHRQPQV